MARCHEGCRRPPGVRDGLRRALAVGATSDKPQSVPFDYALWRLALRMGIPPWVLEGHALDKPPVEWVARCLEFHRMEQSVTTTKVKR